MSTTKRSALGKGLGALLENASTDITSKYEGEGKEIVVGSVANLSVSKIEANPFQPRTRFEKEALMELAESIREHGIIQPVTVRKMGYDKYQLISGERRFKASQIAGLTHIPAYIRVANDQSMLEMALVENIQRQDLDAIEVAISFKRLLDECQLTQEALSQKVSKQRSTVANYLRLLKLPAEIQLGIREGKISMGHARAIVNLDKPEIQQEIYNRTIEEGLSVREVEDLARWQNKKPGKTDTKPAVKGGSLSPEYQKINESLKKLINKKVQLKRRPNGKGKLIIPFYSEDELKKILGFFDL